GIVRFSILLALALVALAVVVQVGITLALKGRVDDIDIVRSVLNIWINTLSILEINEGVRIGS
ncbi:hypothetical protein BTO03_25800, partial [Vibrio parahaemolyticus]